MSQLDLFRAPSTTRNLSPPVGNHDPEASVATPSVSGWPGLPSPRAHKRDPRSSHEAAREALKFQQTHARIVLDGLRQWPCSTSAELALALGMGLYAVRRRLDDLHKDGQVRQFPSETPCAESGKRVLRWEAL